MDDQSRRWWTGIRLLVCAGLAGIIALELSSSLPFAPRVTATPPAAPMLEFTPEPAPFKPPPSDAFGEISARPLFTASRRPFVTKGKNDPDPPPTADETLEVELIGTLLTDRDRAALLQPAGQNASWFRLGEEVAGWHIDRIERNRITLRLDDEVQTLSLRADLAGPDQPTRTAKPPRRRHSKDPAQPDQAADGQDEQPEQHSQ